MLEVANGFGQAALFVAGLILLWRGGERSVQYSMEAAYLLGITDFFMGFFLIGFSTGFPELIVAFTAIFKGVPELSVADLLGSNFCDVALVLGIPLLSVRSIKVYKEDKKSMIFMLFVTTISMALVFAVKVLNRIIGVLLVSIYGVSFWYLWRMRYAAKALEQKVDIVEEREKKRVILRGSRIAILIKLILSIGVVLVGAHFSISNAVLLSKKMGISLDVIGSTIFAFGTSIPELTLSINALRKRNYALAVGNTLGSILMNGTLLLGILVLGIKKPISLNAIRGVGPFMFASFAVLGYGLIETEEFGFTSGLVLCLLYVAYIAYVAYSYYSGISTVGLGV